MVDMLSGAAYVTPSEGLGDGWPYCWARPADRLRRQRCILLIRRQGIKSDGTVHIRECIARQINVEGCRTTVLGAADLKLNVSR
jgi:hypothetical protein